MKLRTFTLFLLILCAASRLPAQTEVLSLETFLSQDKLRPGDEFKIGVRVNIFDGWHVNSHKPSEEFLIPTVLKLDSTEGIEFAEPVYPEGEQKKFAFSETPLSVYEGKIVIWATGRVAKDVKPGKVSLRGKLAYQACNDVSCLIPTEKAFSLEAEVVAPSAAVEAINQDKFGAAAPELGKLEGVRSDEENRIGSLIAGSGLLITLGFIFLGGLALNLTPCVYPLIPITISFFVGQASGKISRSFFLALIYVLGMALTYSLLGVVAAMTGGLLGSSLQNPAVLVGVALIFLIFAAGMFGAFEIRIPLFLSNLAGGSRQGVFGSFFMGLTVGVVAAPCIGPFVLSLLTYVAAQGDPYKGFLFFFVLSLGLGLPFLILGTFSGAVKRLPRSGEWMVWVKKVFGVVMVGVAVYFVNPLLSHSLYVVLLTATALVGGLYVGLIDKSTASFGWFRALKVTVGLLMVVFGAWTSFAAIAEANAPTLAWQPYDDALVAQARQEGKPVLIDFFADWCLPCKQIEKKLFHAPQVVEKGEGILALKADLTKENSPEVRQLRQKYQVRGVPTILLFDAGGREIHRFTDELLKMPPEEFARILEGAFETNGS